MLTYIDIVEVLRCILYDKGSLCVDFLHNFSHSSIEESLQQRFLKGFKSFKAKVVVLTSNTEVVSNELYHVAVVQVQDFIRTRRRVHSHNTPYQIVLEKKKRV